MISAWGSQDRIINDSFVGCVGAGARSAWREVGAWRAPLRVNRDVYRFRVPSHKGGEVGVEVESYRRILLLLVAVVVGSSSHTVETLASELARTTNEKEGGRRRQ